MNVAQTVPDWRPLGADRLVAQRAGRLAGPLDHGMELLVGQRLERAVDVFETCRVLGSPSIWSPCEIERRAVAARLAGRTRPEVAR